MKLFTAEKTGLRLLTVVLAAGLALTVSAHDTVKVTDQPYKWKSVAVVAGGFVSGIMFHPAQKNLLYCRTDIGGAYRWDQKGQRWIPLLDWLTNPDWNLYGIESLGLDPSDPKRLYLACGTYTNEWAGNGAILRSDDQGRTFKRSDLPFKNGGNMPGRSIGERLAVDPNDGKTLYFGSRGNGLWTSTDRAETWRQAETFPVKETPNNVGVGIVIFDPRSGSKGSPSKTVYVFVADKAGGIYRTTDGGATWGKVPGQPEGFYAHHAFLGSNGQMIITFGNAQGPNDITGGAVFSLDTATDAWADISPDRKGGFGYAGLSVDPLHPNDIVVSTLDRWSAGDDVFRSHDGGKSWSGMREKSTRDSSLAPYMKWGKDAATFGWWTGALAMDPFNTAHLEYGTGANIWTTFNGNDEVTHWAVGGVGIEETADIDLLSPATGPHLITALGDIGGFTHDNLDLTPQGGMTANPQLSNTDCLDSAALDPSKVVRVGRPDRGEKPGGYSTDAGETWTPFANLPPQSRGSGSIALTADGKYIIWAPARSTPCVCSFGGGTWIPSTGVPGPSRIVADRVNPQKVYALCEGTLYISSDGGRQFVAGATGLSAKRGEFRAADGHEGDLWLPTDGGLMRSVDSGRTFTPVSGVNKAQAVGFGKSAPGKNYPTVFINGVINGDFGVFRSDDEGASWVRITDAQHEYGTRGIVIGDPRIYGRVYLGTNGRGVFYGDIAR